VTAVVFNTFMAFSAKAQTFKPSADRIGNDYRTFDLPVADPQLCQQECRLNDKFCRAWT
jgi:hypothetical protein